MSTNLRTRLAAPLAVILCIGMLLCTASAYTADLQLLTEKVEVAVERGKITYSTLYNIDNVAKLDLQAAAKAGLAKGGKVFFNFDTLSEDKVVARVTINPFLIKDSTGSYNFMLDISSDAVSAIQAKAATKLGTPVAVIKAPVQSYGMNVILAAKLDLTGMNTAKLTAYTYNEAADTYTELKKASCYADEYGFVHLQANDAGYIVIASTK